MKKLIVGNWKMYMSSSSSEELSAQLKRFLDERQILDEIVIAPSFPYLHIIGKSNLCLAAQNVSEYREGAHTGEVSAKQLKDLGCKYVIVGHSERRNMHNENSILAKEKAEQVISSDMLPIICVGETLKEKESGMTANVLKKQVSESTPNRKMKKFIVAYEPVWAIGSGKIPTTEDIEFASHVILAELKKLNSFENNACILYGGSVKSTNCQSIMACSNISGLLVGGASLKIDEFTKIISLASEV
ncbi:MAG: triose-phosphate isomerase [Rickettsiales bacterium]